MKYRSTLLLLAVAIAGTVAGCATRKGDTNTASAHPFSEELRTLKTRYAPDGHMAVYTVAIDPSRRDLVLTGEVDRAEARLETLTAAKHANLTVTDEIRVLPDSALGETNWGITCLSVANGREGMEHKAELGTQTFMGEVVRVLKRQGRWIYVQSHDKYLSWMESGSLKLCTRAEADAWEQSPLVIVTSLDGLIREAPEAASQPISDLVIGCRVKKASETGNWLKVELPDGRTGYLEKSLVTDYATWKNSRHPTPESIETVAKQFIGRPYLWGANTPRGMDCSGLTKLTFFINGIELNRNASQQAHQGMDVPLDKDLSQLKKGDLLFFGFEGRGERRGRVSHAAIYLGNKLFIQSSQRVRISSLDPDSPIADQQRIRGLIKARRILPNG